MDRGGGPFLGTVVKRRQLVPRLGPGARVAPGVFNRAFALFWEKMGRPEASQPIFMKMSTGDIRTDYPILFLGQSQVFSAARKKVF